MLGYISCFWCHLLTFFITNFLKKSFWNTIRVSNSLDPNVPLSEAVCRTNDSTMQTQDQDHTSRSWDIPLNLVSFKLLQPFDRFSLNITQMFLSVSWCAEPMNQVCKLKVKVPLQRHWILWWGIMAVLQTAVLS